MSEDRPIEELLSSPAEGDRVLALSLLMKPESECGSHLAEVMQCLRHESEPVRHLAVVVLGRIGPPAMAGLVEALGKMQTPPVRMAAAAVVAGIGPPAAAAVPELCRCLTAADEGLRGVAVVALGKIGAGAVDGLRRMLQFSDPIVIACAVNALSIVGKDASSALPEIRAVASRGAAPLQLVCAAAMTKISCDPRQGLSILVAALGSADPATRVLALEKLGELGPLAMEAAPYILGLVRDPEKGVRAAACLALGRIKGPEGQALQALSAGTGDAEAGVRLNAVIGMSAYGKAALAWRAYLEARLADPETAVGSAAKAVLEELQKA